MKQLSVTSGVLLSLILLSGCHFHIGDAVSGSGNRKTEKRDVASFQAINTQGAFSIEATSQKPASVEIEADDNILPLVTSEVRNGVLYLKSEKSFNSRDGVFVKISMPELSQIDVTGAGQFKVQGLKNDRFAVHATGASTITASGEAKAVEIHSTGAGLVDTHSLRAANASVHCTGAGKVDVYASDQLDATASGAGYITYRGDPKVVNKKTSGAATISKREETGGQ